MVVPSCPENFYILNYKEIDIKLLLPPSLYDLFKTPSFQLKDSWSYFQQITAPTV